MLRLGQGLPSPAALDETADRRAGQAQLEKAQQPSRVCLGGESAREIRHCSAPNSTLPTPEVAWQIALLNRLVVTLNASRACCGQQRRIQPGDEPSESGETPPRTRSRVIEDRNLLGHFS